MTEDIRHRIFVIRDEEGRIVAEAPLILHDGPAAVRAWRKQGLPDCWGPGIEEVIIAAMDAQQQGGSYTWIDLDEFRGRRR